jgi:hypothetical protein
MKLAYIYDHHNAVAEWSRRELDEWLSDIFEVPQLELRPKCTPDIRRHVASEFEKEGWALDVKLDQELGLTVFAMRDDLAFQLQTGNMSRAPYDLLKLQYLYTSERIQCAALAVPTRDGAGQIGDNIANADRLSNELKLFSRVISVPIMLIAFE